MKKIKLIAGGIWVAAAAGAVTVLPLNETFDQDPFVNAEYMIGVGTGVSFVHDAANGVLTGTATESAGFSLSTLVAGLGGGVPADFAVSAKVNSSYWQNQILVLALSTSGTGGTGYAAYFRGKDEVAIKKDGKVVVTAAKDVKSDGEFVLMLTGTYNAAGGLELTFTVTDEKGAQQTIAYSDASPLDGRKFGVAGRIVKEKSLTLDELQIRKASSAIPE